MKCPGTSNSGGVLTDGQVELTPLEPECSGSRAGRGRDEGGRLQLDGEPAGRCGQERPEQVPQPPPPRAPWGTSQTAAANSKLRKLQAVALHRPQGEPREQNGVQ